MFKDLVRKNRSYRRFFEDAPVSRETLVELVDHARLSASGANKQPLKYLISSEADTNDKIFPNLLWAGALPDWPGPIAGERPAAYIVVLLDKRISPNDGVDNGIAAQTIMLAAVEKGLGGCILANICRDKLKEVLQLPDQYEIKLVLALGKPKEEVIIDEIEPGEDTKYWRDEAQVHHVPKRKLADIILA